ncbi:MAG: hypothetical protein RLY21_100 [Planctomycetota bacterium]
MSAFALAAALLVLTPTDAPVRIVSASETQLDLEILTAPSSQGGAVLRSSVRFTRESPAASWRLSDAPASARVAADSSLVFDAAALGALRPLGPEIASAEGDSARVLPLPDGDAAVAIVNDGAVTAAYFADDLVPALVAAQTQPRAKPTGFACLAWPLSGDEGATRLLLIALCEPRARETAAARLAAEPMRRTRDVRTADADAARAAVVLAQPPIDPSDDSEMAIYRWIHGCLEATREGS